MSIKETKGKSNSEDRKKHLDKNTRSASLLRTAQYRTVAFLDKNTLSDLYVVLIIVLVGFSGFGLGRLSVFEEKETLVHIEYPQGNQTASAAGATVENKEVENVAEEQNGLLVASKNGSKYHFPWCSGAQRMKEENKIWFDSSEEARKAGYTPAANCKGLK